MGCLEFGFVVLKNSKIVSAATPADFCEDLVEVQINTHLDFRRRGLALAVASRFLINCMRMGCTPEWDAGNEISAALARRLGFQSRGAYEVVNISGV